ncbi:MAG TPA: hypothetical protein VHC90_01605 [Bryobacteraceae bacterium]|nr:hypothetical protein [Bryobacteraceae bacterium]
MQISPYDLSQNPLNRIEWAFGAAEVVHIASMALSVGTIAMVDFAMLGVGVRGQSPAKLLRDTELLTGAGLVIVISSGMALFSTDPFRYYYSPDVRLKMALLLVGCAYNYTIHRRAPSKLVGAVSLAIWIGVVFCGLFFGFTAGGY